MPKKDGETYNNLLAERFRVERKCHLQLIKGNILQLSFELPPGGVAS